ncbi:sulfur relay (sulfurtransferase) DsrF/TusC family protein [Bradyrhizobium sp. USDA 4506]
MVLASRSRPAGFTYYWPLPSERDCKVLQTTAIPRLRELRRNLKPIQALFHFEQGQDEEFRAKRDVAFATTTSPIGRNALTVFIYSAFWARAALACPLQSYSRSCSRNCQFLKDISMSLATTQSIAEIRARNKELIEEVLKVYPEKTARNGVPSTSTFTKPASRTAGSSPTSNQYLV